MPEKIDVMVKAGVMPPEQAAKAKQRKAFDHHHNPATRKTLLEPSRRNE